MNALLIVVLIAVGFLLFLIIVNRNQKGSAGSSDVFYQAPEDHLYHQHQLSFTGTHETQPEAQGDWGGRDMSFDGHHAGHSGDSGFGGDGGGDAGGGDAGGGGE